MDEQNQGFVNMGGVYAVRTFNSFSHELISSINDSEEFKKILNKESHQYICGFSRCLDMIVKHLEHLEVKNILLEIEENKDEDCLTETEADGDYTYVPG